MGVKCSSLRAKRCTALLGEPAHRRDPGLEEVLAAAGGAELRDAGQEAGRRALDGHLPGLVVVAGQGVAVVAEVEDVAVVEPLALHELELAAQVCHAGHEEQPPHVLLTIRLTLAEWGAVGAAPPAHPVTALEVAGASAPASAAGGR